ncbi:TetR/AcrR family transcriptional regulator [Mycolicibacterium peregrinum]|uniref:TetR/AcrR family transcriptional regulator n=1 Tax=Mycolicibacterium peregrinum TaxID=43304 RepID=A0A4Z0HS95_MYCPR|nr:TetR/AcrR family transcriptional regulator [Mycolicibacterium peregrinum]TGB44693.1 TetR/AcrR family transcriptional regulator [Mycolicibacterium peregrinum]TGB46896.1 TetR/AcrR family transcriptional regulator [Mycolicibacterium peregrinum]
MGRPPVAAGAHETPEPAAKPRGQRTIRGLDAEQRRAHRREQLLTAAFELIARDGYPNTSIEQICQAAYVGNKAFYEVFDSKEDCYLALLTQIAERIEEQAVAALADAPDDPDETVHRLLSAFAHALVDDPRVAVVAFGECAGISPRVERARRENRRWTAAFLEGLWRQREFPCLPENGPVDYHDLAVSTVGGLFESVADWLHQRETSSDAPPTIDTLIGTMTTFVSVVRAGIAATAR